MNVIIVGAGGHGQVVADILLKAQGLTDVVAIGFVDDNTPARPDGPLGLPVLGTLADLPDLAHEAIVVAVGDNATRADLVRQLESNGEQLIAAVHPSAVLALDISIERGAMVCAGAVVNTATQVGVAAIINTGATVDHHNIVGDFAHIAPGVHMGGGVSVGTGAFVGIGASVLPKVRIGDGAIVGAGAVVTRDVPAGVTVVGIPARPVGTRSSTMP